MKLDDPNHRIKHDPQRMLAEIDSLPDQLVQARELGEQLPLTGLENRGYSAIVFAGMGGSAIGADLLAALAGTACSIPVFVHRDYGLPAFARGKETLLIACSHSGNTEETLDAFETGAGAGCSLAVVSTGGKLAEAARARACPVWLYIHRGMPRAAVGYSFVLLQVLLERLGLMPGSMESIRSAAAAMQSQMGSIQADVPSVCNPAKQMAGKLANHWINVYAAGPLTPVARRWKCQINELAKAGAGFETIPEANHNALAGLDNPQEVQARNYSIFIRSPSDLPRNRKRLELTQQVFMRAGLRTDHYDAQGGTALAHMWTALHFGDYLAYYLAMIYGVDPTPIEALDSLKALMQDE